MPQNWQIAAIAFVVILVILLRWLLSWWLRITDILNELRKMNDHLDTLNAQQRTMVDALRAIQYNTSEARPLSQPPPQPLPQRTMERTTDRATERTADRATERTAEQRFIDGR